MNIRFSKDQIRIRIKEDDYEQLKSKGMIYEEVCVAEGLHITFQLKLNRRQAAPLNISLKHQLFLFEFNVELLEASSVQLKKGLTYDLSTTDDKKLKLTLELDLKKKKKRKILNASHLKCDKANLEGSNPFLP